MPLAGRGMLMTSMDVAPEHDAELNRWYDREHLAERVAIPGFLEARRYVAAEASPRYLCLYSTATFEALDSPEYRTVLASQTDWSRLNISRFRNMGRAVARITASRGQGRGAVLGLFRLRPRADAAGALRDTLVAALAPGDLAGILSMHLLEADPALSISLTEPDKADPGAGDWYVLADGSELAAVEAAVRERLRPAIAGRGAEVSAGTYRLLWDLARSDL